MRAGKGIMTSLFGRMLKTMNTLRALYISTGAIVPYNPPPYLPMDDVGRQMEELHMLEDDMAAQRGELSEIPLFQVPEHVLQIWERREKEAARAAARI